MKLANIATLATASIGLSTLAVSNVNAISFTGSGGSVDDRLVGEKTQTLPEIIQDWTNYIIGFCALIAVLYGIYGGFLYLTAGGNDESVKKAKTIFKQVAIGLLVIVLSYSVVTFFIGALNSGATNAN